jgi:hypothetical protein
MTNENDSFDFGEFKTPETTEAKEETTVETTEEVETEETSTEETTETTETVDDNSDPLVTTFSYFKEKKILPDTAEFDGTEEGFIGAIKTSVKDEVLDEIWNNLPSDEGKALLEYMLNGGTDINKFKETFNSSWEKFEFSDDEDTKESQQKQVLVEYYKTKGFTQQKAEKEADLKIKFAEADEAATEAIEELKELEKVNKQKLIQEQKEATGKAQKEYEDSVNSFVTTLKETKDINGVPVTDKERNAIFNLYYGTVDTPQGKVNTFNAVLNSVLADPEKSLKLAQFVLGGLSTDAVKKTVKTEAVKGLRDRLKSTSEGNTKVKGVSGPRSEGTREIASIG